MRNTFVILIVSIFINISIYADNVGQIAFTKSEFTREGFEENILGGGSKSSTGRRGWWELSKRNICIINPDGKGFKQITDDGFSYSPRWSPDGSKIAFCSGPLSMVSLNVINPDGSGRTELISDLEQIYDFRWSPDGKKILVFLKTKRSRDPETWVISINDKNEVQRMGSGNWARGWNHWESTGSTVVNPNKRLIEGLPLGVVWPEWSPDNKYIVFIHNGRLVIADALKTGMPEPWKPTKTEPPCDRIGYWSWSPDGKKFLFFARGNVCSVNFDGQDVKNLSMSWASHACWSPDGTKIAFTSTDGRKRNTEIFIMNSDGMNQIQITNTNYFHEELDWR